MSILRAHVADPKKFTELATRLWRPFVDDQTTVFEMHPDAYRFEPQGARIHLAIAPTPETYGNIHLPIQAGDTNGLGLVFAVGPMALRDSPHPHGPLHDGIPDSREQAEEMEYVRGADLLYRQVMIKKFSGTPLAFDSMSGDDFYDNIVTCSVRDILAIDFPENRPAGAPVDGRGYILGKQLG